MTTNRVQARLGDVHCLPWECVYVDIVNTSVSLNSLATGFPDPSAYCPARSASSMARRLDRALCNVSWYSLSGTLSATTPPPAWM